MEGGCKSISTNITTLSMFHLGRTESPKYSQNSLTNEVGEITNKTTSYKLQSRTKTIRPRYRLYDIGKQPLHFAAEFRKNIVTISIERAVIGQT